MAYEGDYRKRLREVVMETSRPMNELCYDIDKSHSYLSDVINGRQGMKVEDLLDLCGAIGVKPKEFFDDGQDTLFIPDDCSPAFIDLIYEAKKCDDLLLNNILGILKEINKLKES